MQLKYHPRGSSERLPVELAIREAEQRMMEPICQYLDSLGVQYKSLTAIHVVTSQMAPKQILGLIQQPYVEIVCPDAEIILAH